MIFENLQYLWLFWIIPLLFVLIVYSSVKKKRLLGKLIDPALQKRALAHISFKRGRFKLFLLVVSIFFLVLTMIGPKWGFQYEEMSRKGVDIIFAVDVSKSMLSTDVPPSRLDRAKYKIKDMLKILKGDRVALIPFAGSAFLQVPLTLDYSALDMFVDDLSPLVVSTQGTNLAEPILLAIKTFEKSDKSSRALIFITDGEDHSDAFQDALLQAKEKGIKIFIMGMGSPEGSPIPDIDGGFKKDSSGTLILSKLDEGSLQNAARDTGGFYVRSVTGDDDLNAVYKAVGSSTEEKELKGGKRKAYEERFQWSLAFAIFLILFEMCLTDRKKKLLLTLTLLCTFSTVKAAELFSSPVSKGNSEYKSGHYDIAQKEFENASVDNPQNSAVRFNLGAALYKKGDYQKSKEHFTSLLKSSDLKMKEQATYNLGNIAYQEQKLEEAISHYEAALKLDPKDEDAKHNLEFVKKVLEQKKEEKKEDQKKKNDQKDEQEKKQEQGKSGQEQKDKDGKKEEQKEQGQDQNQKPTAAEDKKDGQVPKPQKMSEEQINQWLSALQEKKKSEQNGEQKKEKGIMNVDKDW